MQWVLRLNATIQVRVKRGYMHGCMDGKTMITEPEQVYTLQFFAANVIAILKGVLRLQVFIHTVLYMDFLKCNDTVSASIVRIQLRREQLHLLQQLTQPGVMWLRTCDF